MPTEPTHTPELAAPVPTCVPVDTRTIDERIQDAESAMWQIRQLIDLVAESVSKAEEAKATLRAQAKNMSRLQKRVNELEAQITAPSPVTALRSAPGPIEGCKLVALHTGDGWYLAVQAPDGNDIGMLEWPEQWPEKMTSEALRLAGFEIL